MQRRLLLLKVRMSVRDALLEEMLSEGRFDDVPRVVRLACVLDPRFKSLHFLSDESEKLELYSLLEEEAKKWHGRPRGNSSSFSSSSSSSSSSSWLNPWSSKDESESLASELARWRLEPRISARENPLVWWRKNSSRFPTLAFLAKRYLCIPASSAPSERVFSKVGIVLGKRRGRLAVERTEQLVFLQHNYEMLQRLRQ